MSSPGPARNGSDLADVVEMLLDKGVVINADIAVSIGDTELLGIHLKAAIASFETAAQYGLAFPEGTDTDRIAEITGTDPQTLVGATGGEHDETAANEDDPDDSEATSIERQNRTALAPTPSTDRANTGSDGEREADDEPETDGGSDTDSESEPDSESGIDSNEEDNS